MASARASGNDGVTPHTTRPPKLEGAVALERPPFRTVGSRTTRWPNPRGPTSARCARSRSIIGTRRFRCSSAWRSRPRDATRSMHACARTVSRRWCSPPVIARSSTTARAPQADDARAEALWRAPIARANLRPALLSGRDAAHHLFRVAAGSNPWCSVRPRCSGSSAVRSRRQRRRAARGRCSRARSTPPCAAAGAPAARPGSAPARSRSRRPLHACSPRRAAISPRSPCSCSGRGRPASRWRGT
jgi:hypothetical protein